MPITVEVNPDGAIEVQPLIPITASELVAMAPDFKGDTGAPGPGMIHMVGKLTGTPPDFIGTDMPQGLALDRAGSVNGQYRFAFTGAKPPTTNYQIQIVSIHDDNEPERLFKTPDGDKTVDGFLVVAENIAETDIFARFSISVTWAVDGGGLGLDEGFLESFAAEDAFRATRTTRDTVSFKGSTWTRAGTAGHSPSEGNGVTAVVDASGRLWRRGFDGPANAAWWGVLPGAGDVSAHLQAALDACAADPRLRELYIPPGTYELGSKVTYTAPDSTRALRLTGAGQGATTLRWSVAGGGLEAFIPAPQGDLIAMLEVSRMRLATTHADGGRGLRVVQAGTGGGYAPAFLSDDLAVVREGGGAWETAMRLENLSSFEVVRPFVHSGQSAAGEVGISIDNPAETSLRFKCRIVSPIINFIDTGIRQRGHCESLSIEGMGTVLGRIALDLDGASTLNGSPFTSPHLFIGAGIHLNSKQDTIRLANWRAVVISDADIYSGIGVDDVDGANLRFVNVSQLAWSGGKCEHGAVARQRRHFSFTNVTTFSILGVEMTNATDGSEVLGGSGNGRIVGCILSKYRPDPNAARSGDGIYAIGAGNNVGITGCRFTGWSGGILLDADEWSIVGTDFDDSDFGVFNSGTGTVRLTGCGGNVSNIYPIGTPPTPRGGPYADTVVRTLTGGSTTETVDVGLPVGVFPSKPRSGFLLGDAGLIGAYEFNAAESTARNARFTVRAPGGGNLPAGGHRFSVLVTQ